MQKAKARKATPRTPREAQRVVIVEDHAVVRDGIALVIRRDTDFEVTEEASGYQDGLAAIARCQPAVAVIDLSLQDGSGLELIKAVREQHPAVAPLVLSVHEEAVYAERAVRAGALGYVMKREVSKTLCEAMRQVAAGELHLSSAVSSRMVGRTRQAKGGGLPTEVLSDRQIEVFEYIGRGLGTRAIAEKLGVSVKTVEAHQAHLKSRLGIGSINELVCQATHWLLTEGREGPAPAASSS